MTEHTTSANFWHPISKQRGNWWVMWLHHPISKQFHVWSCDKISHRDDLQQQHLFLSISLQSVHWIVRKCEIHVKTTMFYKLWTRHDTNTCWYTWILSFTFINTHLHVNIILWKWNLQGEFVKIGNEFQNEWIFVLKYTQRKKIDKISLLFINERNIHEVKSK